MFLPLRAKGRIIRLVDFGKETSPSGQARSLYKIVKRLGFRFEEVTGERKILMEMNEIVIARSKCLREIERNGRKPEF